MIRFRMTGIHVRQFAILANSAPDKDVTIDTNIGVKVSVRDRKVALEMEFVFLSEEERILLMTLQCEFEIHKEDWLTLCTEDTITIPKNTIEYFVVQTVGTARGILHCKTEGTPFNHLILPPIDATHIVQQDIVIK